MGYEQDSKKGDEKGRLSSRSSIQDGHRPFQETHSPSSSPFTSRPSSSAIANNSSSSSSSARGPALPNRPMSTSSPNLYRPNLGQANGNGSVRSYTTMTSASATSIKDDYRDLYQDLSQIYKRKIKPLETTYNFQSFHSAPLTESDIFAKPMVLLLGQYSTGKTTFIRHLIEGDYPGAHIGVEPTTDRFVAVMGGSESRVIPGNAAAVSADLPFRGLDQFGQAFLTRFQVSQCPSSVLENMTLIDSPGILAGTKQRVDRGYDFTKAIGWFAERSDLILLFFDSHKLDISDEFKAAIMSLKGQEEKVRVILNKSDMVDQQQLMRVYGAMMWSLGKVIHTPEVVRVYLSSFWITRPSNAFEDCRALIEREQADLLKEMRDLPRNAAIRKVNEIVKRARLARVHAYIIGHLRREMPAIFGKKSRQKELIRDLPVEFTKIQQMHNVPAGDFPDLTTFRNQLEGHQFDNFAKIREPILTMAEEALSIDLPRIMQRFPQNNPLLELSQKNPFVGPPEQFNVLNSNQTPKNDIPPSYWHFASVDRASALDVFKTLNPIDGRVNGSTAKPYFLETGLTVEVLAKIWNLADWDRDGYLDENQFAVAMHLVRAVKSGGEAILPPVLPQSMLP